METGGIRVETDFPAWVYLFAHTAGEDAYSVVYPQTEAERTPRRGEIFLPPSEPGKLGMLKIAAARGDLIFVARLVTPHKAAP